MQSRVWKTRLEFLLKDDSLGSFSQLGAYPLPGPKESFITGHFYDTVW